MQEDFEIPEKFVGKSVILAFTGLIPIDGKPGFMSLKVKIISIQSGSVLVEMNENNSTLETVIPKARIQYIAMESAIQRAVTLPPILRGNS